MAEIAGGQPLADLRRLAEIAEHLRAPDQHLAVVGQAQLDVRQRPADRADAPCFGRVQADHRSAFGQAVALEHRQAEPLGAFEQLRRHPPATDGDEAQRSRQRQALLGGADQRQQQLRQQDQALRPAFAQRGEKARQVEAGTAGEADLGQRAQLDPGTGQQRRIEPGDVFQQGGQRQHAQVLPDITRQADLPQALGHRQLRLGIRADALGLAGGAGGVGDLAGAGRHRRDCLRLEQQQAGFSGLKSQRSASAPGVPIRQSMPA